MKARVYPVQRKPRQSSWQPCKSLSAVLALAWHWLCEDRIERGASAMSVELRSDTLPRAEAIPAITESLRVEDHAADPLHHRGPCFDRARLRPDRSRGECPLA